MNWATERLAAAAEMKRAGHSYAEIAEEFGVSRSAIAGIAKRNRDLFPPETQAAKQAEAEAVSASARFQWTDALIAQAARLKGERRSAREIGRQLGCSPSCVTKMMAAHPELFPRKKVQGLKRPQKAKQAKPSPRLAGLALPAKASHVPGAGRDLSKFVATDAAPKTMLSVGNYECRFPLVAFDAADGPDVPVCGAPAKDGKSWCPAHCDVVFAARDAA
ncbi:GcrA family cell cycle regulator [Martelella endophytica]|uniref:Insertion element IS150 protein InsJ-like helix-turn-helix domain-containing protein n=1 Tax=Martelella endophytica TaxID=1486262 RepID=A0A0D5LLN3_MAREN|nr:GcrA family cell cycle regulator [Martelella endophytica]AJY44682.1 hypothetical protein TM49_01675 [Martelella endophytica]